MSYGYRETPPLTVGQVRKLLDQLPDDATLKKARYSEGFDISQGTYLDHLTGIDTEGFMQFRSTALDTFIPEHEEDFGDD